MSGLRFIDPDTREEFSVEQVEKMRAVLQNRAGDRVDLSDMSRRSVFLNYLTAHKREGLRWPK